MRTITTIRVGIEVASGTVLTEQSSRSAAIVHAVARCCRGPDTASSLT